MDRRLADGCWMVDTRLGGVEHVNAAFLFEGPQPCLVETGAQLTADVVLAALREHGLGPDDLATIVLTHIHLDHGGAVGELAAAFPRATVICHRAGARHLIDPTRLIASAALVYGPALDGLYGRLTPVDADRVVAADDNQLVDLGQGRRLRLVESPGHAKHHLGVFDEASGVLLVGDAVGIQVPGGGPLRPSTPPADFDRDLAIASLHRFAALQPAQVVLSHYGPVGEPQAALGEAERVLRDWCDEAERVVGRGEGLDHLVLALAERFGAAGGAAVAVDPAVRNPVLHEFTSFESNAAGLYRWLQGRAGPEGRGGGTTRA